MENVLPFKKSDQFPVYGADVLLSGEVVEGELLGFAYLNPSSPMFRLKLWMFPKEEYFIAGNEDRTSYRVLCPSESKSGNGKTYWNEVGSGVVEGSFIRLQLYLPRQNIFVCLFPTKAKPEVNDDAA